MLRAARSQPELGQYRGRIEPPKAGDRAAAGTGSDPQVVEPDNRIIFAVLAVGMLVGALLTTPAKTPATAKAKAPTNATASVK